MNVIGTACHDECVERSDVDIIPAVELARGIDDVAIACSSTSEALANMIKRLLQQSC